MEALQSRLDSFAKSKRVKHTSKSSYVNLKWPHPPTFKATPESLAEAGFFYNPSFGDHDNVSCYVCEKQLGGWEEMDDPFDIHFEKCNTICYWATLRCGLKSDMDRQGRYVFPDKSRVPNSKSMEKARLESFGSFWIHDQVKYHGANSKKMALAGFSYTPQLSQDDLASCFYCDVSLSGWDKDDDPMEEHRKRDKKASSPCPFLAQNDILPGNRPSSRSQSAKPPSKSTKPSSRSQSSSKHDILLPTKTYDGDIEGDSDIQPTEVTTTVVKIPRNLRSKSVTRASTSGKTSRNKARSTSRSGLPKAIESEDEDVHNSPPPTTQKRTTRSRSVSRVLEKTDDDTKEVPRKTSRTRAKPKTTEDDVLKVPRKSSKPKPRPTIVQEEEEEDDKDEITLLPPSQPRSEQHVMEPSVEGASETPQRKPSRSRVKSKPVSRASSRTNPQVTGEQEPADIITAITAKRLSLIPDTRAHENIGDFAEDDMGGYILPQDTTTSPPGDLPPLYVPKRNNKAKKVGDETIGGAMPAKFMKSPISEPTKAILTVQDEVFNTDLHEGQSPALSVINTTHKPLSPVANNKPVPTRKAKSNGKGPEIAKGEMKIVEISTDDDEPEDLMELDVSNAEGKENSIPKLEIFAPPPEAHCQVSQEQPKIAVPKEVGPLKVDMQLPHPPIARVIKVAQTQAVEEPQLLNRFAPTEAPVTPPRVPLKPAAAEIPLDPLAASAAVAEPLIVPPLSKLPFTPIQNLAEAELDMTVEEWIRYQMEVEYDKFKRDGERELQRFRKRAEDVRRIIEGL